MAQPGLLNKPIDGQPRAVSFSRCGVVGVAGRTALPENGDASEKQGGHYEAIILKLLSWLIKESQRFGGTILDQFWEQVKEYHLKLKENGESRLFWSDIRWSLRTVVREKKGSSSTTN